MAQSSADRSLAYENRCWPYINKCLDLLKLLVRYILIILCFTFHCLLFKFSSLFGYWLERLYSVDSDEDLNMEQFKPQCNSYFSNPNIQNNEETNKTEVSEGALQHINSNNEIIEEELEPKYKSEMDDKVDFQSSNHEVIEENVEQISQSQINVEMDTQSNANQEDSKENLEHLMLSPTNDEEIDLQSSSPKVVEENIEEIVTSKAEKRCPVKRNAAIFLFSKTMKEIENHDKKIINLEEEKLNKIKVDKSFETPIESATPCQEKENLSNTSDTLNEESQLTQHKPVPNDSFKLANGSHDSTILTQNLSKNINDQCEKIIPTNKESDDTKNVCEHRDNGLELKPPILVNEKLDSDDKKNNRGHRDDSRQLQNPILVNEKLSTVKTKDFDAFYLPSEFSLALCVTEDLQFSMGTAFYFKAKYGGVGKLMDQNLQLGDVGEILLDGQYIFYLVVREKYKVMPSLQLLEKTLVKLSNKMKTLKLTKLAIPKNGFDRYEDRDTMMLTSKIFGKLNIEVIMCMTESKLDLPHVYNCKVNCTKKHLWEMEPQTDLVIFINMEKMYLDNWNDRVVENINNKYPFKHKLLQDINLKPMAAGDILSYKINNEELFCIFNKPFDRNPVYFECLEKALQNMKSQMTGYRYLAVQSESINIPKTKSGVPRHILLLQTVFSNLKAEIWICNDDDLTSISQMKHYNHFVNCAIEKHKKIMKSSTKPRYRSEKKKNSNENVTRMHGYVESSANKKYGNKTVNKE